MTQVAPGRPRDESIGSAVLDVALRHLARDGLSGLSLAAVAAEAGTTRPAIYRRWPDKTALAVAAVARLASTAAPARTGVPFDDLVAEVEDFRHCITAAGALPLVGLMLTDGVDPGVRQVYLEQVVVPRRTRIRACLVAAVDAGLLDRDADLELAGSFLTGSWYALSLAGRRPAKDWARRTVTLVWRSCGGSPP
jgi:AcrR family transcriptional regulator